MLSIKTARYIELGKQGENKARTVEIDCSSWFTQYATPLTINLYNLRPGESTPYLVSTTIDEDYTLSWVITSEETIVPGRGCCEITATNTSGVIVKSAIITTNIEKSLIGLGC